MAPRFDPANPDSAAFDPVAYINTPRWQTSRLGLERMADLLRRMGSPEDGLRFVHVAGTNGKGSVCAYLASVLMCAGYRTGLFTSPFVEAFADRIRVDGENIADDALLRATLAVRESAGEVEDALGDHPTEFELMFAVALEHFRAMCCDVVVCEVGLGGRLDATNVIEAPEVSVITRIGLDHTELLGDTLEQVATEKAGIIKEGVPVASYPQEPAVMRVVEQIAADRDCAMAVPDFSLLDCGSVDADLTVRRFRYDGVEYATGLLGSYQPRNAALAVEVVKTMRSRGWAVSDAALEDGIGAARWPGRFEVIARRPLVIVDGGHNPQAAAALVDALLDLYGEATLHGVVFVMGVLTDKDYREMIRIVASCACAFVAYAPDSPRALAADELAEAIEHELATDDAQAADAVPRNMAVDSYPVEPASSVAESAPNASSPAEPASPATSPAEPAAISPSPVELSARASSSAEPVACASSSAAPAASSSSAIDAAAHTPSPAASVARASSPAEAVACACDIAGPDGIVVAFGSLYGVADVKAAIR